MECTQRLENTQDLYSTQTENVDLEQVGFLGICGNKYPVKKGPNKIGRDPSTCTIVLNLNSISRQHAVINVLNKREYILMDLDSANKTKLCGTSLKPYIPHPLRNGDTVQFGDVFGIFRLLEEEDDLPMTQAIDVPETPVVNKHAARCRPAVIPESPDVSGDDSFVMPSQPFKSNHPFKSPSTSNKYIKPGAKPITLQPIGGPKIDNVFWNSSKKSASFSLNDSTTSVNDSSTSVKCQEDDIHEMETQAPYPNDSSDSIYSAATQLPTENTSPSIHSLETQLPTSSPDENDVFTANKENIFNAETQMFENKSVNDNIFEAATQMPCGGNSDDMFEAETENFEAVVNNKDEGNNIFEAETQDFESRPVVNNLEDKNIFEAETQNFERNPVTTEEKKISEAETQYPGTNSFAHNTNEDKTIFEAETQLPNIKNNKSLNSTNDSIYNAETQLDIEINESLDSKLSNKSKDKSNINRSDDIVAFNEVDTQDFEDPFNSQPLVMPEIIDKDDEEINLTQNEPKVEKIATPVKRNIRIKSDSSTDCEDNIMILTEQNNAKKVIEDDSTDCEELFEEEKPKDIKTHTNVAENSLKVNTDIADLATQVLKDEVIESPNKAKNIKDKVDKEPEFEDLATQVLVEDKVEENFEDMATQVLGDDIPDNSKTESESQKVFSEEIISPFKVPFQTPLKNKKRDSKPVEAKSKLIPEIKITQGSLDDGEKYYAATQDILHDLCTQMELSPDPFPENSKAKTPSHTGTSNEKYVLDKSSSNSDNDEKINNFVSNLTKDEIKEVIGVEAPVVGVKRVPSDPSDVEVTPKKLRPFRLMGTDLPNSQEIKLTVSTSHKALATESSSDSEDSQKQDTPMLFKKHKNKRVKSETKLNLSKKFDSSALPTRVITRIRKPTSKVIDNVNQETKKINESILKPKYLTELDDEPDTDIITQNIIRLKSNNDKKGKGNDSVLDKSKNISPNSSSIHQESAMSDKQEASTSKECIEIPEVKKETRKRRSKKSTESDKKSNEEPEKSKRARRSDDKKTEKKDTEHAVKDDKNHTEKDDKKRTRKSDKNNTKKHTDKVDNNHTDKSRKHVDKNDKEQTPKDDKKQTPKDNKKQTPKDDKNKKVKNDKKLTEKDNQDVIVIDEEILTKTSVAILSTSNTYQKQKQSHRTRSKNKIKDEIEKTESQNKRKRGRPQKVSNEDLADTEVRRSIRQKEKEVELTKSILKNNVSVLNHENSTVYSVSSESDISPRYGKRSALDLDIPSPKRTRSATSNVSLRSTPRLRTQYVLCTAFACEQAKKALEKLGAVLVNDVRSCTVVLTYQIKRTFKLLCAVGLGKPIVGPQWVQACIDNSVVVDPWLHVIKDTTTEQRFRFDLQQTLNGKRNFLKGYNISSTPNVMPSPPEMKLIVECSGGTWKACKPQWIVVSCLADKPLWRNLKQQGAIIVSSEFILSGVLRQKMDIESNRLD